jgi:hypothetical protein
LVAVLSFAAVQVNWHYPLLRFDSARLNHLFLLIAFALPFLAAFAVLGFPKLWSKALGFVLLLPIFAYTALFAPFIAALTLETVLYGYDSTFQPIGWMTVGSYRVTIFRTDCGATCDNGIAVRQERQVLPGILLVRQLEGFYPAYDATYHTVGRDSFVVNDRLYVLQSLP